MISLYGFGPVDGRAPAPGAGVLVVSGRFFWAVAEILMAIAAKINTIGKVIRRILRFVCVVNIPKIIKQ